MSGHGTSTLGICEREDITEDQRRSVPSRRDVLSLVGVGAVATIGAACVPPPAQPKPSPTTTKPVVQPATLASVHHLLRRATFGPTPADVKRVQAMGIPAWLDQQLSRSGLVGAESRLVGFSTLTNSNEQNEAVRRSDSEQLYAELDHATLLRAVYSQQQLYEVMCDFWSNHLNIWRRADWLTHLKTRDNETVIRRHALGKFSDLLMASAKSPAMLVYLDNYQNRGEPGRQVNENYGRELLELHTLGIIDGKQVYSEADILGVAKILSGWTINWDVGELHDFKFNYWNHNREAVSILGGKWSRPARPKWEDYSGKGLSDGESLIRFLARHSSTAQYISWKLARRFVSDNPPPVLVQRLAATYSRNDTAIAPVLRELFLSPEFAASVNQKVKRPIEWLYSALRVSNAAIPSDPRGAAANDLRRMAGVIGQPNFERVSPDGWPEAAKFWVGADGLLKRWESAASIARANTTDPAKAKVDVMALLPAKVSGSNASLVSWFAAERLLITLSAADAQAICNAAGVTPTAAATDLASKEKSLQTVLGLLLAHPAFQRR